jgi:hypothetical protein
VSFFVYVPLLLPLLITVVARGLADRARPRAAVLGLVTAAVLTAAGSVWSLVLLVVTLFDDLPSMIEANVRNDMRLPEPVPDQVALAAGALLAWALFRLARDLHRRRDAVRQLRHAGPAVDGVVVADWTEPLAIAVPGKPGEILLTTGMLRVLGADERRAVVAHERAHLAHRHHLAMLLVSAAVAVNPLLRPVRDTVGYLVERWADEEAAADIGDRDLVARAVARAALAAAAPAPAAALGMHGGVVVRRVRALRVPSPADGRLPRLVLAAAAAVVLGAVGAAIVATADFFAVLTTWMAA